MEISKCLTISTSHVKESTMLMLEQEVISSNPSLCVYEKKAFGFWVHIPESGVELSSELPVDLLTCIKLAIDNDCEWLCLDRDGEVLNELPDYCW